MFNDIKYINNLNKSLKDAFPFEVLELSINKLFKKKIVYVCSFGSESAVILHMISRINKNLPIILINTHFLFEETLDYKNYLLEKFELKNFEEIYPDIIDLSCKDKHNNLWKTDPDSCCNIRKVKPLNTALQEYDAWISGRKSYHNGERTEIKFFSITRPKNSYKPTCKFRRKIH